VKSDSEAALWFSQGYLHARDRFFQMEIARRLAAGRQAEVFGEVALDSDRKMRMLRIAASARRQAAMLTAGERRELEAYAAGVNSAILRFGKWIAPEIWLLGVEPQPWRGVGPPRKGPGRRALGMEPKPGARLDPAG